jgi:hypothetical protein
MPPGRPKSTLAAAVLPVLGGLAFFVVLGLVLWGVAALVSGGGSSVRVDLGENVFRPGEAADLAKEVAEDGPILFPGLVGQAGARAIGVYHVGTDSATGWKVYSLVPPGGPASCVLDLDRASRQLVDRACSGRRYPADGTGLDPVPWTVDGDGVLVIDLTPEGEPGRGTTTVAPATS